MVSVFLDVREVPAHCNILWKKREDALNVPLGDLRLGFCFSCGHVFNTAFEPEAIRYSQEYENSLHFSPFFQDYARELAIKLIDRHDLYEKDIIEIGCGKGDFLLLLSELGGNRGVGFDSSYVEDRLDCSNNKVTFIRDLYSEQYSDYKGDLILSRQVLEHVEDPRAFVEQLRAAIGPRRRTVVFFEVPNFQHTIKDLAIWDIIYEHYSYFTQLSIKRLFSSGFRVERVEEGFDGQFLCLEAISAESTRRKFRLPDEELDLLKHDIASFSRRYTERIREWNAELESMAARGQKAIVWGSGSKGVSFLNMFKLAHQITHAVDINPYKQGNYVPGTGHEIVGPEDLRTIRPDLIIVMNPIYIGEIWEMVKEMGLKCRILTA